MKSPIILGTNGGFLTIEIMIAFSLLTLFLTSAVILSSSMKSLRAQAIRRLEKLEKSAKNITLAPDSKISYGNDTFETKLDPLTLLVSDYDEAYGRDSCNPRIAFDEKKYHLYSTGIDLGSGNVSTAIEVRNKIAYLTADSATASAPDLYIIDASDPLSPAFISSINTGPGLSDLEVAGHYIYVSNLGTTNQLQVIDISNREAPTVVEKLKLPLPSKNSVAPLATSIFYSRGLVYLGTEKWEGYEFNVIDVDVPTTPHYLGGFETDTLVSDIYVRAGIAYLAASDVWQMRVLDVGNPSSISSVFNFSPTGWETQASKELSYFEGRLSLGRTTGGFNNINNHELFLFSNLSPTTLGKSKDIPGGVYGILMRPPNIYLSTRSPEHEFQIWNEDLTKLIFESSLGFSPEAYACDAGTLYFATGDSKGIAIMEIQ